MEVAKLHELFLAQAKLDETIAKNHNVSYETTRSPRTLALLVEIGEFANTTRCFKYWSNKGAEEKDVVLDEYADGLHFFLSLGIDIKTAKEEYVITKPLLNLTDQFHLVYRLICNFKDDANDDNYIAAFSAFLNILPLVGYTWKDLEEAYYKKLGTNYHRQETNY